MTINVETGSESLHHCIFDHQTPHAEILAEREPSQAHARKQVVVMSEFFQPYIYPVPAVAYNCKSMFSEHNEK